MPTFDFASRLSCAALAAMITVAVASDAPLASSASAAGHVQLNQLGFRPAARKIAVAETSRSSGFHVIAADTGKTVFSGTLQPPAEWNPAGRSAAIADFSPLTRAGQYRIEVDGLPASEVFSIDASAYSRLADAALKGFYFMRASTALAHEHAGAYARNAGHPDTKVAVHASAASVTRPAGTMISAPRGWYDAGDYNKYVVNSGISTYTLLAALEHFPGFFRGRDIGIPESGNKVPDILDEARWNLLWMLDMQDPEDGGVYHKLTTLRFDGPMLPERDMAQRYVVQKTTAASLDFAAVLAVASRLHKPYEKQFPGMAARMRQAAEKAWHWAQANPSITYRQPADVVTGAYGDRNLADEFVWAAAELYLLTGDTAYLREYSQRASPALLGVPSWSDVGGLALISLANARARLPASERAAVTQQLEALASKLAAQWHESPWKIAMQPRDFVWGSNAVALNQAIMLLQAYRLGGSRDYLDAAQSQLDYILGRNPLGVTFVTGQGSRSPLHIHHRPSQADGVDAPVPGLLSGGPNPGQQDARDCAVKYASSLPALSWLDNECSYASNEIAINWNAPLVYVASALQALKEKP